MIQVSKGVIHGHTETAINRSKEIPIDVWNARYVPFALENGQKMRNVIDLIHRALFEEVRRAP